MNEPVSLVIKHIEKMENSKMMEHAANMLPESLEGHTKQELDEFAA